MKKIVIEIIVSAGIAVCIGAGIGYWVRRNIAEAKIATAENAAKKILEDAERSGEAKKKEALLEAKEEIHRFRSELERETKERRNELQRLERRLLQKEENLDRKIDSLEKKEESLSKKERNESSYQYTSWSLKATPALIDQPAFEEREAWFNGK